MHTKHDLEYIRKLLNGASDKMLEMSRFDCHIRGLHSVVVGHSPSGGLKRIFFTDKNHEMSNSDFVTFKNPLGIHSHRYDIELYGLVGRVFNVTFERDVNGSLASCFEYRSREEISYKEATPLSLKGVQTISPRHSHVAMGKDELHTVYVPKGQKCAWLVYEGREEEASTLLYTNLTPACMKHYTMSADVVRRWGNQWLDSLI